MKFDEHVVRIDALTRNARNVWFLLLSVLVFVVVTMMGVEDIDFYGVDRATKLPLVDLEVPTRLFFLAAPILCTAVYAYFHLYLIRLWNALSAAPVEHEGCKLGNAVTPWLVTDMGLQFRPLSKDKLKLDWPAFLLNFLLAWVFGLFVAFWLWWESATARDYVSTNISGFMLLLSVIAGFASANGLVGLRAGRTKANKTFVSVVSIFGIVALASAVGVIGAERTAFSAQNLASPAAIEMPGAKITEYPAPWQGYEKEKRDHFLTYCEVRTEKACDLPQEKKEILVEDWVQRWEAVVSALAKPDFKAISKLEIELRVRDYGAYIGLAYSARYSSDPNRIRAALFNLRKKTSNLSHIDLREAHLVGSNFSAVTLNSSNFRGAQLQSAGFVGADLRAAVLNGIGGQFGDFRGADLRYSFVTKAELEHADFQWALADGSGFESSNLQRAKLREASFIEARFNGADLYKANFFQAVLSKAALSRVEANGVTFSLAALDGATLKESALREARFVRATLANTNFNDADLSGATLDWSYITSSAKDASFLGWDNVILNSSSNNGGAVRNIDLRSVVFDAKTDWRNTFLDASVLRSEAFNEQMNNPCQWIDQVVENDAEFLMLWRWWFEHSNKNEPITIEYGAPRPIAAIPAASKDLLAKYSIPENCTPSTTPIGALPSTMSDGK